MKLRIEDITAEVKEIAFSESEAEVNRALDQGVPREYRVEGPFEVEVSYYRAGTDLFFSGKLSAHVRAICARCAEEFDSPSRREFRFVLAPQVVGEKGSGDLSAEDLEFSTYTGDEVELSPLIREQLLLALPTKPLCRDDCRGLCPVCGANRNLTACQCSTAVPDPRLAVLRSFKVSRRS